MAFWPRSFFSLCLMLYCIWAGALHVTSMKQETQAYLIDIQYPQGFSQSSIDRTIQKFVEQTQKEFLNELSEDEDTPADAPGKTGLHVRYTILYDAKNALSVRFDVSIYHRGAAHPLNNVATLNFIQGEKINLVDLFHHESNYLPVIASFCHKEITKKQISEARWIDEGTKPSLENYSVWYFTDQGIDVLFVTYQVAAYVYGPINIAIPLSLIAPLMKSELLKMLWGR